MIPFSLFSPATKHIIREAWKTRRRVPWDFLHSYVYARWPYTYIAVGNGEHPIVKKLLPIFRTWRRIFPGKKPRKGPRPSTTQASGTIANSYQGKVIPFKPARDLVMVNKPINLPDLEQVIPYVRTRAIIQHNPGHILLVKCPCRMSKEEPCLPVDVCMVIGDPFVGFIEQHYPSRSRRITQEEACDILEKEDDRGRVHHAFFSEMMLGRFYAICNCCSCCCSAMKAHRRGTPMLASSGYVAQVDEIKCISCNECEGIANSARSAR